MNLHVNAFEIVAVQLTLFSAKQKAKSLKNIEYLERKCSKENEYEKQIRLQKGNDYKKFKLLEETDSERQLRLQNKNNQAKKQPLQETDTQKKIRLKKLMSQ